MGARWARDARYPRPVASRSGSIGFRWGFLFALLVIAPFPIGWIPGTWPVAALLQQPVIWAVEALAALLGIPTPSHEFTGSGDTMFEHLRVLLFALIATGGALIWSLLDRRAVPYPRLWAMLRVLLRYWVGSMMLIYGAAKLIGQFPTPSPFALDARVGDRSPMGLLWTFMGHSQPYVIATGVVEIAAGALLIARRTATLGALLAIGAMTNVVLLNLCYDVPVKLFSLQLLVAALAVAAPDARRLIAAALGHATAEVPPRPRTSPIVERLRSLTRALVVIGVLAGIAREASVVRTPSPSPLDGAWDVERFVQDGVERAPLTTDGVRWRRFLFVRWFAQARLMTDGRVSWWVALDERDHTIVLGRDLLAYARPDADHLVLDGTLGAHRVHVTLARAPAWLLPTRGFHWIQEAPFHR